MELFMQFSMLTWYDQMFLLAVIYAIIYTIGHAAGAGFSRGSGIRAHHKFLQNLKFSSKK